MILSVQIVTSTSAETLEQEMGASLNKELVIARKVSSGEGAGDEDGVQMRKKSNSFV